MQVVDVADSITYDAHDTDDAIKLGLVSLPEIADIPLVHETMQRVRDQHGMLASELMRKAVVHMLINVQVSDVLQHAGQALAQLRTCERATRRGSRDCCSAPPPACRAQKRELEDFLYTHVYRHPRLIASAATRTRPAQVVVPGDLSNGPTWLPDRFRQRVDRVGLERTVADYLAGMTDRFCEQQYESIAVQRVVG